MVKRRKEDFSNYVGSVLQNSMLTGVPQIASAANAPKKILRALVFIFCLVGFVYQSMVFMNMYWEYKTVIDIQVENPKRAVMPSITMCTNNGLMTSKVCADPRFNHTCLPVTKMEDNSFCDCMPNFCVDGILQNITVPYTFQVENFSFYEYDEYKPFLMPFKKVMLNCYDDFREFAEFERPCELGHYQNIRCPNDDHEMLHACYTIHTLIGAPDGEADDVSTQTTETLILDSVPKEYNIRLKDIEFQISIHNSKNILNPYVYGYGIKKGHTNMFRLTKTVKHLLPPPYETNCMDYLTEWKNRGGKGPTNEKECIEECQRNSSMELFGCIIKTLRGPTNDQRCHDRSRDDSVLKLAHECAIKHCKPACDEVMYEATTDVTNFATVGSCYFLGGERFSSIAKIVIKLDGLTTTTYTYSPKFQNIETFSYVGGYVGMWLGISLVAVFDFLETMVVLLRYPFRQFKLHRARKARVDHIRKIQRNV